jgi:hypothetical protein
LLKKDGVLRRTDLFRDRYGKILERHGSGLSGMMGKADFLANL